MPTTFEHVARQVVASLDSNATYLLAHQWVTRRYEQLAVRAKLKHLRQIASLSTPAAIDTGTVDLTRGTRTVTGDADATAVWGTFLIGRHIRLSVTWYEIVGFQLVGGFGVLTLADDFNEDTIAAGSYRIVQRFVPLAADAAQIGDTFINPRRRWAVRMKDYQELERRAPSRPHVGGGALVVAEVPFSADGVRRVELYPYSTVSETYFYVYWRSIGEISLTDYVPAVLPVYGLIEGALIDLMRYKMGQAIDMGKQDAAALWRNEMRTQETKWQDILVEMISADQGEDDSTVIMKHIGGEIEPRDITTAQDHVLAGWDWTA